MKQGWKPEKFTESGKPATDDEVISKLKFPLARIFSAYAEYNKLINTFVLGIEEGMDSKGFCHGSFNQMTTKTTRMSSSSPNLQNLPARTALGAKIRECVVAPPGYSLVVGDLDQIELRVLAYYLEKVMGDSAMAKAARQGIDAHTANAKLWGVSRKQAKGGIFAVNYGASAKRLAITLKTSEQDAKALIENINTGSPSIAALKQLVWKACKKRGGYIYLLFGHRVFYPDITSYDGCLRSAAERQTFNCLIQGSAGAIHKELMLRGMPYLRSLGGMYACTVHDEVLLYVPTENCEKLVKFFNEVYHNKDILCHDKGYVPVTAEFKEGSNWVVAKG
jgi:DNA polymerase-1